VLTIWHTIFLANQAVQIDLQPKNRYNRNVETSFDRCFFLALKRYDTSCHLLTEARTKSKDIGGSDRLTGGCVCRRVNRKRIIQISDTNSRQSEGLTAVLMAIRIHILLRPQDI
jgi:hypothetical protein